MNNSTSQLWMKTFNSDENQNFNKIIKLKQTGIYITFLTHVKFGLVPNMIIRLGKLQ
jgi:hypothetical protein